MDEHKSDAQKRILLVEDDDALANVYVTRLQAEGFDIRRVADGEEALASALNYHPDLVLLDVMMPKVSGFDVLDILRNTPETAKLKIIMITALSQDSDKQRAESLGVDDYLVKSQVVIADVVERIRHHLESQKLLKSSNQKLTRVKLNYADFGAPDRFTRKQTKLSRFIINYSIFGGMDCIISA